MLFVKIIGLIFGVGIVVTVKAGEKVCDVVNKIGDKVWRSVKKVVTKD